MIPPKSLLCQCIFADGYSPLRITTAKPHGYRTVLRGAPGYVL
jgi:hypothetical protein